MVGLFRKIFKRDKEPRVPIDREGAIRDARYVALDTELSGLDDKRDSVISIGALRMSGASIIIGDAFYCLTKPKNRLSSQGVLVHGIMPSELADGSELESALSDFLLFCGSDLIVGHFIEIDISFINKEMRQVFGIPLPHYAIDTFVLYRMLLGKGQINAKNGTDPRGLSNIYDIARMMGINVSGAHNALMDAYITAQVFQHMIPELEKAGVTKIGQLLRVGDPSKGGDKCLIKEDEMANL